MQKSSVFPRLIAPDTALVILCLLLIAAFGLRVWNLNAPSIWHDEGWSIRAIRDPIGGADDKTPLAYYSLIHLLWNVAGESPFALRYGSTLLDMITCAGGASGPAVGELGRCDPDRSAVMSPLLWLTRN
jgi:hypothetical protein